ncbi:glycoside hydrolase family 47 protein [Mycena rebaudengoi]|nr:glycoside hydrolase family 47 protein [Mycena rebaudengoi]
MFVVRRFLRWWHLCLFFAAVLWLGGMFSPYDRFRFSRVFRFKTGNPVANGPRPPPYHAPKPGDVWAERADAVRKGFLHAYKGYQTRALPYDELLPVSGGRQNNFHAWGVTMFDSLDTMWLMGLEDLCKFPMEAGEYAHFFEVVIRYLGGLLSAYALSEDPRLLRLADDLGEKLLPAFNTPSGFARWGVNTQTGEVSYKQNVTCLAESHSNQMEYKYLAHITGKAKYFTAAERPMEAVYGPEHAYDGLLPTMWGLDSGAPETDNLKFSPGGCVDSAYEYFLKQWLMTAQMEPKPRDLYIRSANAILEQLVYVGMHRELMYATQRGNGTVTNHFEHLSCYLPAVLALGAATPTLGLTAHEREMHRWAAEGLANTCWTQRGLWAPQVEAWEKGGREGGVPPGVRALEPRGKFDGRGYAPLQDKYLLRPEAVETFYLMWRTTGDVQWRERGWAVFQSLEKWSRVEFGYTTLRYLDEHPFQFDDMPSWFMAETLKYLFLLFTDEELVPLDKWVFNTEAHPLPVFQWSQREIEDFHIYV